MEAGTRIYKREWAAPAWRGLLAELIDASQTALDELDRASSGDIEVASLGLEYRDGDQAFRSLTDLKEMNGPDREEITGFQFVAQGLPALSTRIDAGAKTGIHVVARAESEAFAIGITAALTLQLTDGMEAGKRMMRVPLNVIDVIACTLVVAMAGAIGAICLLSGLSIRAAGLLALSALGVFWQVAYSTVWIRRSERRPPAFEVMREGGQLSDNAEARSGRLWQAKRWIENRPGLGPGLYLLAGALLSRLAQIIHI